MEDKQKAGTRPNIHSLTGLRGVAAVAVVIRHCWLFSLDGMPPRGGMPGQWAVDLFFVLSGFVLALTYLDRPIDWRRFAIARVARIYPLHIVTACAMALILIIKWQAGLAPRDPSLTIGQTIREFSMLTAMPLVGRNMIWNYPSWSISVEAWTYALLFPVIAAVNGRIRDRWAVVFVGMLLISLTVTMYRLPADVVPYRGWVALGRAMIEFAGGWAAYLMWKSPNKFMTGRRTDALAVAIIAILISVPFTGIEPWILTPLFPLLVLGLAEGRSVSDSALSGPRVRYLGDISFSIYLLHPLVILAAQPALAQFGLAHSFAAMAAAVMPVTIAVSAISYRFFEKPSRDLIRRSLDPKDKREPRDVAVSF